MAKRRLPLTALRTFEAAARLESFKEAAEELGVSATTVSNQVRMLERDWGTLLFVRKTRQLVLTEAGRSLSRVVQHAFEAIASEIDSRFAATRSAVPIAVGAIFGSRWLIPRLGRFRRELPRIELSIQRGKRFTGAADMPTAIAVDWGHGDWPGLDVQFLLAISYAPILSPALAETLGGNVTVGDLARLPILHQQERSEWRSWLDLVGASDLRFAQETIIDDSNLAHQAAIDGQGVALGIFPFIQGEVDAGRLIKPFAQELQPSRAYFILTKPGSRRRTEIAAVYDWLLKHAQPYRAGEDRATTGADAAMPARATRYARARDRGATAPRATRARKTPRRSVPAK